MFKVEIDMKNNNIIGEFIVDSYFFDPSRYDYAYYLYRNDQRIDSVWYTDSMRVKFKVDENSGTFYIKVFVVLHIRIS